MLVTALDEMLFCGIDSTVDLLVMLMVGVAFGDSRYFVDRLVGLLRVLLGVGLRLLLQLAELAHAILLSITGSGLPPGPSLCAPTHMAASDAQAPPALDPVGGMTVCPIAVILEGALMPGNDSWGSSEIGSGVTVLSGGNDERNWSRRYWANLEKLASGDLALVVEVVRDLAGREASSGLSAGKKRMLVKGAPHTARGWLTGFVLPARWFPSRLARSHRL